MRVRVVTSVILTLMVAGGVNTSVADHSSGARLAISPPSRLSCAPSEVTNLGRAGSHREVVAALDGYSVSISTTVQTTWYPGLEELHPTDVVVAFRGRPLTSWQPLAPAHAYLGGIEVPATLSATRPIDGPYSPICLATFPGEAGPDLVMTVATGVVQYVDEELEVFSLSRLNAAVDDLGFVNLQLGRIGSQLAILTTDASFEGVFAPDSMSYQPIEILAPQSDAVERIAFVTENFPRFVSASAAATWKTYIAPGASASSEHGFYDPLDVLASWTAEQCVIGRCAAAFDRVRSFVTDRHLKFPVYGTASLDTYLARLRSLLIDQGYLRPSAG
jgi:hypothetical protein